MYKYKHILKCIVHAKPHILWQLLVCLPRMPRFSSGMLYLQNLSISWKNKHSHPNLPASLYPYLPVSCQEQQSKRKEQRQKSVNSMMCAKENKQTKANTKQLNMKAVIFGLIWS